MPRSRGRRQNARSMAPLRALLVDALGTTVRLLPPWEQLAPATIEGLEPGRVRDAFKAEMTFYAAHAHEARDAASLAELRETCARILSDGLGRDVSVAEMMEAIVFEAYPDGAPALDAARERELRVVCVSNWDFELPDVLARVGLADSFDAVVVSALVGARKPDPAIFVEALAVAGCEAGEALHVGDTEDDVAGATAAGIAVLRVDREGGEGDLRGLDELPERLARWPKLSMSDDSAP